MYSPVCVVWNYRIRYYWPGTTSLKASLVPLQECDQVPGRAGVTLGRMSIQITKHTEVSLSWSCCPPGPSRPGPCVVPRWVPGGGGGFCHGCPGSTQTREPQAGRSPSRTHAHRAEGKKTRGGRQSLGQFVPWLGAGATFPCYHQGSGGGGFSRASSLRSTLFPRFSCPAVPHPMTTGSVT